MEGYVIFVNILLIFNGLILLEIKMNKIKYEQQIANIFHIFVEENMINQVSFFQLCFWNQKETVRGK